MVKLIVNAVNDHFLHKVRKVFIIAHLITYSFLKPDTLKFVNVFIYIKVFINDHFLYF